MFDRDVWLRAREDRFSDIEIGKLDGAIVR